MKGTRAYVKIDFSDDGKDDLLIMQKLWTSKSLSPEQLSMVNDYYDVIEKAIGVFHERERSEGEQITDPIRSQDNN